MHGRSSVREVDLETGEVLRLKALPEVDFGEGIAKFGGRCTLISKQLFKASMFQCKQ